MTEREKADNLIDRITEEVRKHKQQTSVKLRRVREALEKDQVEFLQWENE